MKKLLWTLLALVLLGVGAGWWLYERKDALIADAIRTYGPQITGVSVKLGSVKLEPSEGRAVLNQLELGNPGGFHTPHALVVQQLTMELDLSTLAQGVVHIRTISLAQPQLTYEHGSNGSNLDVIQRNVQVYVAGHAASSEAGSAPKGSEPPAPQKKLRIDLFSMRGAKVDVGAQALQGKAMTVPLPDVNINGIGNPNGVTPAEAAAQIVAGIKQAVVRAITPLHVDSVVDRIKKGAGSVVESVKGFFK